MLSAEIVALIAAAVAVFAAVLAVRATALTARTVLAAHGSQAPKRPEIAVVDGHTRRDITTDTRDYAFGVTVRNPMAADWRCAAPTLRVTYRTRANFIGAIDVAATAPLSVAAGDSVTTTLRFTTSNVIPRHCRIDAYTLLLIDAEGQRLMVDASLPAVLQADSDGAGSATWGWD